MNSGLHQILFNRSKIILLLSVVLVFFTQTSVAQSIVYGTSFSFLNPVKDFEKTHTNGYGIKFNAELEVPGPLSFTAEIGWNKWMGDNLDGVSQHDYEAWDAVGGFKLNLFGPLYAGARAGFYFGEQFDQFVFIPSAGLSIRRFDFNLGYQVLYDRQFVDARIGFLWGGRK
jgi:hypothetical protein